MLGMTIRIEKEKKEAKGLIDKKESEHEFEVVANEESES
jgi:hypothetical protein